MGAEHLRPWKPGQSGNPTGRPKLPEALRLIKALSKEEVCRIVSKYARLDLASLLVISQDPQTQVIDLAICSIFYESIKKGDYQRLAFLLDRAIGAIDSEVRSELQSLSTAELLELVKPKEVTPA